MRLSEIDWEGIEGLRSQVSEPCYSQVEGGAQLFVEAFCERFPTVVLARLFLVLPFESLPPRDAEFARALVKDDARLKPATRVLSLLGSSGHNPTFVGRLNSSGHLAIPLLDRQFVQEIPMITRLLADLEVDFQALDDGRPIATRKMLGGRNSTFYVADAATARDEQGRSIIPARDFVESNGIRTVFGMGGAYIDGTLAAAILFTQESLERPAVDRFASFINTFKMSTAVPLQKGAVYAV
jgi:hypothetical protein